MAITVAFTTNQVVGSPNNIVINDASSGSDVNAVARRVYITNAAGQYLTQNLTVSSTPAYTLWALADGNTLTLINIISQDSALNVNLQYVDISGNPVAALTLLKGFTLFNESFYYTLTQSQAQQNQPPPNIIQDSNYYSNKMILRVEIDAGDQAIILGNDITTAQGCYDRASYMVAHQSDYF